MSVAFTRGGEPPEGLHIYREARPRKVLADLQQITERSLANPRIFHARGCLAVSLLTARDTAYAYAMSPRLRSMNRTDIMRRLLGAIPLEERESSLRAEVAGVKILGGECLHLAVLLDSPDLEMQRTALLKGLRELGATSLAEHDEPCHVSLGSFSRQVPKGAIMAVERDLPAAIDIARVIPKLPQPIQGAQAA